MKKGYWISLYFKIDNSENLRKYAEIVTPIIKSFGGVPLVRGGEHKTYDGDNFIRAIDCRSKRIIGKDYVLQDGDIIKIVAGS